MVPIFGRRKRPRQAFYASPSQDICKAEGVAQKQANNECHENSSNQFRYKTQSSAAQIEDDNLLDDFNCEDTCQNNGHSTSKDSSQCYSGDWFTRSPINQTYQNIPLHKHPR